jgi:hypothetical protein
MGRPRIYHDNAERQRAHRERQAQREAARLEEGRRRQADLREALWELHLAVRQAAAAGDPEAARLTNLDTAELVRALAHRFTPRG